VKAALEKEVQKAAIGAKKNQGAAAQKMPGGDPIQMLTVVAHKELPYETLYWVLKTAGRLEINADKGEKPLKYFKFLVLSNAG